VARRRLTAGGDGSVEEHRDSKIAVTVGSQTRFFDIPSHKDIDTDTVVDLRHMLSAAGYEPQAEEDERVGVVRGLLDRAVSPPI
jgi:hypothetical protein